MFSMIYNQSPACPVKYYPSWLPGAGFKKEASETKRSLDKLVDIPFQFTLDEMVSGISDNDR
jgi:hypothetical protein